MAFLSTVAEAIAVLGIVVPGAAQAQTADEYQVKAAYMYNLAKFVDWPPKAFLSPSRPIMWCARADPLSTALQDALVEKVVGQRPLQFHQITDSKQAGRSSS